jgi:polyhydroxybutyrate depolymerase
MKANLALLFTALALGHTAAGQSSPPEPRSRPVAPGDHDFTLRVGTLDRRYTVHVPPNYNGKTPVPVVVMLHGGGGTSQAAATETGWGAKADAAGFLAVFPNALPEDATKSSSFGRNPQLWNDGSDRFRPGQKPVDDVGFLNAMLDHLQANFAVDARRIYFTGFSNGASMAFRVGAEFSPRIAAIAPVAGACWLDNVKLARPVPMLYLTGTADPLNLIEGGVPKLATGASDKIRAKPKPPVRDSILKWVAAVGAPALPRTTTEANGVRTETYGPGREGAEVIYVSVEGLGHTWAGGKSLLPAFLVGPRSDKLKVTDLIWNFFEVRTLTAGAPPAAPPPQLLPPPPVVPAQQAELYHGLERILDAELARPPRGPESAAMRPVISLDLLVANSNRGPALLLPESLEAVRLSLDRFKELGVGSVKFALHYPLLRPDFPRQPEYLAFYRQVVAEARLRGLKVMPHVTVMFSDTPFSVFKGLYRGLDLARFQREYRAMVHLIVSELQPDYLGLLSEPDTHARLTGLRQLNTPATMVEVINFALAGLQRGCTKVGAGSGSWSPPAFAQALAEETGVDFIGIHVYPITGPMLGNARQMAQIAHAHGKQAVIDEAWLYKELRPGGGEAVAATAEVFRRDVMSFWQPLDQKFITLMLRLAAEERVSLVSFFWSSLCFSYLDTTPELDQLPYAELTRRHNRTVYAAMQDGRLSEVGRHLQRANRALVTER